MKIALTVDIPDNFKIRGYDMPMEGDYVLSASGDPIQVHFDDHAYHCCGIILDKVWEPQVGALYEFSDDPDYETSDIREFSGYAEDSQYKFYDIRSNSWMYMRPIKGVLGT